MSARVSIGWACIATLTLPGLVSAQTLQGMARPSEKRVEIFADGNIKNVISQGDEGSAATGSLGLRYLSPEYTATGIISIAGSADTIVDSYGSTLLAPATGKALNSGLLDIRRRTSSARISAARISAPSAARRSAATSGCTPI